MNSPENMDYLHDGWSLGKPAIGLPPDLIFGTARIFTTRHDSWRSRLPTSSISCLNEGGDRLEKVFSVDEKTAIRTLDRLDPVLTLKHNHRENFICAIASPLVAHLHNPKTIMPSLLKPLVVRNRDTHRRTEQCTVLVNRSFVLMYLPLDRSDLTGQGDGRITDSGPDRAIPE
jgi:hypothetical protein